MLAFLGRPPWPLNQGHSTRRRRCRRRASAGWPRRTRSRGRGEDFVVLERAERGRRHLAGQHLSGLRLRRPVAPVLALLRAQSRTGPAPSPGSRRSATTCARVTRDLRPRAAHPLRLPTCSEAALGRRRAALADRDQRRADSPPTCSSSATGPLADPRSRTSRGSTTSPGEVFHSAALGPRLRPRPAASVAVVGTGASAIQFVPAIQPQVGRHDRRPAHPAVGDAADGPRDRPGSGGCTRRSPWRSGRCAAPVSAA